LLARLLPPGFHRADGRAGWAAWFAERLVGMARTGLFPIYASLLTPLWLRLLGARVGRRVEASTVLALPHLIRLAEGSFLADDARLAAYELRGGWLRVGYARVGERAFVGNSGMVGPGREVPDGGLVGVLSAAPAGAPAGSSWLGQPPMLLPRKADTADPARTFDQRLRPPVGVGGRDQGARLAAGRADGCGVVRIHHRARTPTVGTWPARS
jgi:non-ribosomal peptide synthetase-like protein